MITNPIKKKVNIVYTYSFLTDSGQNMYALPEHFETEGELHTVDLNQSIVTFDVDLNGKKQTHTMRLMDGEISYVILGPCYFRHVFKEDDVNDSLMFLDNSSEPSLKLLNETIALEYHLSESTGFIDLHYDLYKGADRLGSVNLDLWITEK